MAFVVCEGTFIGLSNENGGAIFYQNAEINVIIQKSSFRECQSTKDGGAIYIDTNKAFISMIQITNCSGFDKIGAAVSSNKFKGQCISISKCYVTTDNLIMGKPLHLEKSKGKLNNYNSTDNICNHEGSLVSRSSPNHSFKYININNDFVVYSVLIQAQSSVNCFISYLNIINCRAGNRYGIIRSCVGSNVCVENCVFYNNTSPTDFCCDDERGPNTFVLRNYCCQDAKFSGNVKSFSSSQCVNNLQTQTLDFVNYCKIFTFNDDDKVILFILRFKLTLYPFIDLSLC